MDRRLEITWEDPATTARATAEMSGLEFIRALVSGVLPPPPISSLMSLSITEADEGRVVCELDPGEQHYNPIGTVHGGTACTILDSAMGCAVHTTLPAGVGYTTLELKVNFLRPITAKTGKIFCEGRTIHVGRSIATAEAMLTDRTGKKLGHATGTCVIFRAPENPRASEGVG